MLKYLFILVTISAASIFTGHIKAQGTPAFPDLQSPDFITTASGLRIKVIAPGTGDKAVNGKKASAYYAGWLENGVIFDTNMDGGSPYRFHVGFKEVIPGWDEAFTHLAPGGKAYIIVPSRLGYGDSGVDDLIPGGATLVFYIELAKLK